MAEIDWLPKKDFYEYAYHKYFNPEVRHENWQPWDQWDYPDRDVLRFEHIIKHQLQHITNKRVLDIGCHLGYISLFCLHNDAQFVTGTNIRHRELSIAKEICGLAGYSNVDFVWSDLHNLTDFKNLCDQHDTVLLSGIMYHVNNHYAILDTVKESLATTVVIESQLDDSDNDSDVPKVNWIFENSLLPENGMFKNKDRSFVGVPNQVWFEQALLDLGFTIVYNNTIQYVKPNEKTTTRCILTATKGNI